MASNSWYGRLLHGRVLSLEFFKRYWAPVLLVVAMLIFYVAGRYTVQTQMEQIRSLERDLEVAKTEKVRAKSAYMSRIRETQMQHMVDSLNLGITVPTQPPYYLK